MLFFLDLKRDLGYNNLAYRTTFVFIKRPKLLPETDLQASGAKSLGY